MPTIIFPWQNKELAFDYLLLWPFALSFPVEEKYLPLAEQLVKMGIPSISSAVLDRIPEKEDWQSHAWLLAFIDKLWADGAESGLDLRRQMLWHEAFVVNLCDADASWILETGDPQMLAALAWRFKMFSSEDANNLPRLSSEMAAKLRSALEKSSLPVVQAVLSGKSPSGTFSLLNLMNYYLSLDLSALKSRDLEVIKLLPIKAALRLALEAFSVQDQNLRKEVYIYLLNHIDPLPRLILAIDDQTPKEIMAILKKDIEPDVVRYAVEPPGLDFRLLLRF